MLENLTGFLSNYSDSFALALILWPAASLVLTLPILALLYRRDGRLRASSAIGAYLSVLYLLGLICFTLYPLPDGSTGLGFTYGAQPQLDPFGFIDNVRTGGLYAVLQIVFNVVLFMPLGFITGRMLRWGFVLSTLIGLVVSLLVETAQLTGLFGIYDYAYRTFDVDDIVWNTIGSALGWAISAISIRAMPPGTDPFNIPITDRPGFVRRCVALWIDVTLAWMLTLVVIGAIVAVSPDISFAHLLGSQGSETLRTLVIWALSAAMVLLELVVPALRGGRTLGGGFVRMTCETRKRHGWRRAIFYMARFATLLLLFAFPPPVAIVIVLFYAMKRCMPYDLI